MPPHRHPPPPVADHLRGLRAALGAYLPLGLGLVLLGLVAFAALAALVVGGATQGADDAILLWLHDHANPWLDSWALKITALGSTVVVVMMVVVVSAFLWVTRHRAWVLLLWVAMLGGAVLSPSLKRVFDRDRPELWERDFANHPSFPSGHAVSALIVYGTLAYVVVRLDASRPVRRLTVAVAGLVILLIGLTRLYLGVHYPSDVLAGYAAALAWASLCALGMEAVRHFRGRGG